MLSNLYKRISLFFSTKTLVRIIREDSDPDDMLLLAFVSENKPLTAQNVRNEQILSAIYVNLIDVNQAEPLCMKQLVVVLDRSLCPHAIRSRVLILLRVEYFCTSDNHIEA